MPSVRSVWIFWLLLLVLFSACAATLPEPEAEVGPPIILMSSLLPRQKICIQWTENDAGFTCTTVDAFRVWMRGLKRAD